MRMTQELTRRDFLRRSGMAAAGVGLASTAATLLTGRPARGGPAVSPNERLQVGFIGMGGRGTFLMRKTLAGDLADVVAVSDASEDSMNQAAQQVEKKQSKAPAKFQDFRKLLEMKEVQAVLIASPDHWHPLQTILACQAGKDVYVEKPISQSIAEGLAMIKTVRETKRICQVGLMQRSGQDFQDAVKYVQSGKLGPIGLIRTWFVRKRESLGSPKDQDPPKDLNWDLWLGPAPLRPYNPARYRMDLGAGPYGTWRWFWDYAGGQLCDWGPHMLDVVRWAMNYKMPLSASAAGGNFVIKDCRECPDTLQVLYEYPGTTVVWEHRQWSDRQPEPGRYHGIEFYGEKGSLFVDRTGWEVFPEKDGEKGGKPGTVGQETTNDEGHIANFLECVKSRKDPVVPIEEGFMTTAMCQLGNIAYRSATRVVWDDAAKTIKDNPKALEYLSRAYRAPWKLPA